MFVTQILKTMFTKTWIVRLLMLKLLNFFKFKLFNFLMILFEILFKFQLKFLKLLENFSNTTPPNNPILGQGWYNTSNNSLNVCYAEASGTVAAKFKSLSKLNASDTAPADVDQGQFWYDLVSGQLNIWSGSEYITIGPEIGANIKAKWRGDFEYNALVPDLPVFNIKAVLGTSDEVVAIVSAETYDMSDAYTTPPAYASRTSTFTKIVKGITLQGADPITGSSRSAVTGLTTSSYFWGTAAESLNALHANVADSAAGISAETTGTNLRMWVPFINTTTNLAYKSSGITYNPADRVLYTIIPAGSATLEGSSAAELYANVPPVKSAILVVSVEIFQSVTASGNMTTNENFNPSPFVLGRSLQSRIIGLLSPFIDVETMAQ